MSGSNSHSHRVKVLAAAAAACLAGGWLLSLFNTRWSSGCATSSFTLASAGWVLLLLLALYWLVEVKGYRKAVFPARRVGVNSIFIYSMHMVLHGWYRPWGWSDKAARAIMNRLGSVLRRGASHNDFRGHVAGLLLALPPQALYQDGGPSSRGSRNPLIRRDYR